MSKVSAFTKAVKTAQKVFKGADKAFKPLENGSYGKLTKTIEGANGEEIKIFQRTEGGLFGKKRVIETRIRGEEENPFVQVMRREKNGVKSTYTRYADGRTVESHVDTKTGEKSALTFDKDQNLTKKVDGNSNTLDGLNVEEYITTKVPEHQELNPLTGDIETVPEAVKTSKIRTVNYEKFNNEETGDHGVIKYFDDYTQRDLYGLTKDNEAFRNISSKDAEGNWTEWQYDANYAHAGRKIPKKAPTTGEAGATAEGEATEAVKGSKGLKIGGGILATGVAGTVLYNLFSGDDEKAEETKAQKPTEQTVPTIPAVPETPTDTTKTDSVATVPADSIVNDSVPKTRAVPATPADSTRNDSVPAVPADSTRNDSIPAVPADSTRNDSVPAVPADSTRNDSIPAVPADSTRNDSVPAVPADSTRNDSIPAVPADSTRNDSVPAVPADSTRNDSIPAVPADSTRNDSVPAVPADSTRNDSIPAVPADSTRNDSVPATPARITPINTEVNDTASVEQRVAQLEQNQRTIANNQNNHEERIQALENGQQADPARARAEEVQRQSQRHRVVIDGAIYTINPGDNLWRIAQAVLEQKGETGITNQKIIAEMQSIAGMNPQEFGQNPSYDRLNLIIAGHRIKVLSE